MIDGTGDTRRNARIFISDDQITRIDSLRGSVTYDLSDLTIMPGWIDTHVHLMSHFDGDGKLHRPTENESTSTSIIYGLSNAYRTLMSGFTTVQSLGSPLDSELRDWIMHTDLPGPRVLTSREPITIDTGDAVAIRTRIRQLKSEGADVIKVFASASIRDGGGRVLSDDQLNAACEEGLAQGLRVAVHAYGSDVVSAAARAGCTSIEHGNRYDNETIALTSRILHVDNYKLVFQKFREECAKPPYTVPKGYEPPPRLSAVSCPLPPRAYKRCVATSCGALRCSATAQPTPWWPRWLPMP